MWRFCYIPNFSISLIFFLNLSLGWRFIVSTTTRKRRRWRRRRWIVLVLQLNHDNGIPNCIYDKTKNWVFVYSYGYTWNLFDFSFIKWAIQRMANRKEKVNKIIPLLNSHRLNISSHLIVEIRITKMNWKTRS